MNCVVDKVMITVKEWKNIKNIRQEWKRMNEGEKK